MKNKLQLSVDPHNKAWTSDTSKFGYQMMLKMGWTEGKGLGAKEDGNLDHVKSKKNLENRGVGCDAKSGNNWLENTHGFADVLAKLNAAYAQQPKPQPDSSDSDSDSSEEEKKAAKPVAPAPKALPKHLIYQKRHRNKNVSAYDKTDLAAILGGPRKKAHQSGDSDDEEAGGDPGLRTSAQSMDDYFRARQTALAQDGSDKEGSDDERPSLGGAGLGSSGKAGKAAIGFQYSYQPAELDDDEQPSSPAAKKSSKKKSSKAPEEAEAEAPEADESAAKSSKKSKRRRRAEEAAADEEPEVEQPLKKSKKSKKSSSEELEEPSVSKGKQSRQERVESAETEEAVSEPVRKKKSRRAEPEPDAEEPIAAEEVVEERPKKEKRKKQRDVSPKAD